MISGESSRKYMGIVKHVQKDKRDRNKVKLALKTIPKPPHFSPLRLMKKQEEGEYWKLLSLLMGPSVNIPLVEVLEKKNFYAKFIKNLVTKKRAMSFEPTNNVYHCSAIVLRSLVKKEK